MQTWKNTSEVDAMSTIDEKRAAFHQYLSTSGVISALSKALIKLYEEPNKPDDPVNFVRRHMGSEDFFILGDGKSATGEEEMILSSLIEQKNEETVVGDAEEANGSEVVEDVGEVTTEIKAHTEDTSEAEVLQETDGIEVEVESNESESDPLAAGFDKLKSNAECNSLLKTYLVDEIFEKLKNERSDGGASFFECIKSGLEGHDAVVGVHAIDPRSYDKFSELFDPIVEAYHGFGKADVQPDCNWGDSSVFEPFDDVIVVSLRISCARNLLDYPFVCKMLEADLNESFEKLKSVIESNDNFSDGTFYNLANLTEEQEIELTNSEAKMENSNPVLASINLYQQWPLGRGVFVSKSMIIEINGEDHIRFIMMQTGDFGQAYKQLVETVNLFDLAFVRHDRLGWLAISPTNIGTNIHVYAELKLSKLYSNPDKLQEIIKSYSHIQLKPSGNGNEDTFTLTNQSTMGLSEFDLAQQFYNAIQEIIQCEKSEE